MFASLFRQLRGLDRLGGRRSPQWFSLRKWFLEGKICAVCGKTDRLEAHHIEPFHINPSRELDPKNLIALCEGMKSVNCHLWFGHLGDYRGCNPDVVSDASVWNKKMGERYDHSSSEQGLAKSIV